MFYKTLTIALLVWLISACTSTSDIKRSPLHQAAFSNDLEEISSLIGKVGHNGINLLDEKGFSPLMTAIQNGHNEAALMLLKAGANIHVETARGETAFILLSQQPNPPIEILTRTFDINSRINQVIEDKTIIEIFESSDSISADAKSQVIQVVKQQIEDLQDKRANVMAAMDGDDFSAVEAYVQAGGSLDFEGEGFYTPLMKATNIGNLAAMEAVLKLGADVNYQDSRYSETAIFETVSTSDLQAMQLLIKYGADLERKIENDITILMRAVMWNDIPMAELLLDAGANINASSKTGWAPLHWTVNSSENQNHDGTNMAQMLIQRGAEIDARTSSGYTALNLATVNSHPGAFFLLMEAGADVHIGSDDNYTPIINALYYDQYEMVTALIDAGVNLDKPGNENWAPIHWTVNNEENQKHSGARYIKLLIEAGVDLNAKNESGNTPARLAAINGRVDELRLLVEAGADLNIKNDTGHTPLISAVIINKPEIVSILLAGGADVNLAEKDGWAPIHWSVNSRKELPEDSSAVVQLLVDAGAKLNMPTASGNTPIRLATANDRLSELKILLVGGANPNIGNDTGYTPLMDTISNNSLDMAKLLIEYGADVNLADNDDWAPLHWTTNDKKNLKHDALPFAKLLIKAGADLNARTNNGYTTLNMAILNGHLPIYELLLETGADINIATVDGYSPLIHATTRNHLEIVKQLVVAGADVSQATDDGWTALHFTVNNQEYQKHDASEILKVLLEAGVDIEAKIEAGFTALMLASYNGRVKEAELLLRHGATATIENTKNRNRKALDYAVISGNDAIIELLKSHLTAG